MLTRTWVEKTLYDLGGFAVDTEMSNATCWRIFSYVAPGVTAAVQWPDKGDTAQEVLLQADFLELHAAFKEHFSDLMAADGVSFRVTTNESLEAIMQLASRLVQEHPQWAQSVQDVSAFDPKWDDAEPTEAKRQCRVRLAQNIYRQNLEALWGGRCAVTGVGIRELLRASHAKPWAECSSGAERVSAYNGFLLTAHLDALFDKFLISFDDEGKILLSPELPAQELAVIGVTSDLHLRFVRPGHLPFLHWHRERFSGQQTQGL